MNIIQDFIPAGRANRPGKQLVGPKFITIHDTGNANAGADALAHARYLKGDSAASRPASWHFTVDDKNVIQHLPLSEVAWHAGDGNGPGNASSIGIEICENSDGDRAKAEERAADLAAFLLKTYKLPVEAVVQHNKWSGKNCPHIIRGRPGGWEGFLQKVRDKMKQANKPTSGALDKAAAEKVIAVLGALWTASGDKLVQAAAHHAANSLRDATGIERPNSLKELYPNHFN